MEKQVSISSGKTHLAESDLGGLVLEHGVHRRRQDGVCLMEAVAWFAGKEHTDRPPCVSPVLGAFGRALNDRMPKADRQQLKRFIPVLPGTAGSREVDRARAWLALDWLVRVAAVAWLDAAGLADDATALQELGPVLNDEALEDSMPVIRRARDSARRAYNAAWDRLHQIYSGAGAGAAAAAAAAAAVAAGAGAADGAGAAAVAVAVAAVAAAAAAAAVAAVGAAVAADAAVADAAAAAVAETRARVREAVGEAARERLQPVVSRLQASALDLFGRMIETRNVA
jgi:hypothetical protein